jgi:precorrin-8X/cobalt-precorrin-8 methylmutase
LPAPDIMPLSLQRLRDRSPVELPPEPAATVMLRMAYAAGDPGLLADIVVSDGAVHAVTDALHRHARVVCDVEMVAAGLRTDSRVLCAQDATDNHDALPHVSAATQEALRDSTRTARGLLALIPAWHDSVVVVGNAPTALLAVLDALADGAPRPAALIATPCGLVAAEEAKQLLIDTAPLPFVTVRGTRGGSAVAAAAVNACMQVALTP